MSRSVAALSLAMLLSSLGTSIANVALPTLTGSFDASFQAVQWVVLAYLLAITALIVSVGRLGDLVGRRRLLLVGVAAFTAASAACAVAPTLPLLVAARAAQGLGAAIMMALALALVAEAVPSERTGRAMGLLGTTSAIGTALGPSLGGALVAAAGWRAVFAVLVPVGAVAFGLAWRSLPPDRAWAATARPGFDAPGTVLLALTLGAYALATTVGRGSFGALNAALLVAAVVGAGLFLRVESRAASPLVRLALLRDGVLGAGLAMSVLVSTVLMATLVVGPFHLARALGLDAAAVGLALAVGPVVVALAGVPAGRAADRLGTRPMTVVGLTGVVLGASGLAVAPAGLGVPAYLAAIVVLTLGYALFQTANTTAVMAHAPADGRGVVSGLLNLSRNVGLITGASVLGAVFAAASSADDAATARPGAVATGTHATFAVAAALAAVALAIAIAGWRGYSRPASSRSTGERTSGSTAQTATTAPSPSA